MREIEENRIATAGVIDLGAMGKPVSTHLLSKNCQVAEYDVKGSWAVLWNPRGFVLARDPAEVGEKSELNLAIVTDDAQGKEACLGAQGDT